VCGQIKQLKNHDCINLDKGKIYGMKSHDCHVFMQRLIPLAFHDMLPRPIWKVLTELSLFFKEICAIGNVFLSWTMSDFPLLK